MEENKIAEKELYDRFIDERVNMILIKLEQKKLTKNIIKLTRQKESFIIYQNMKKN